MHTSNGEDEDKCGWEWHAAPMGARGSVQPARLGNRLVSWCSTAHGQVQALIAACALMQMTKVSGCLAMRVATGRLALAKGAFLRCYTDLVVAGKPVCARLLTWCLGQELYDASFSRRAHAGVHANSGVCSSRGLWAVMCFSVVRGFQALEMQRLPEAACALHVPWKACSAALQQACKSIIQALQVPTPVLALTAEGSSRLQKKMLEAVA